MRGMVAGMLASFTFAPAGALSLIFIFQLHQALPPYQRHLRVLSDHKNWLFAGQEQGFLSDPMRAGLAWQPTALHHAPAARHPAMHRKGNTGNRGRTGMTISMDADALTRFMHREFPQVASDLRVGSPDAQGLTVSLATGEQHLRPGGTVSGGEGDDVIAGAANSRVNGDAGNDTIAVASNSQADGGAGNDTIAIGNGSTVTGGAGNDVIAVGKAATINYARSGVAGGDGNDIVSGDYGSEGSKLKLNGMAATEVKAELVGKDLKLTFQGSSGSITFKDFQGEGPQLVFSDGATVDVNTLLGQTV